MPVTKQKKEDILKELMEKFDRSKSIVFTEYRGLDVASLSKLRDELRKADAEMQVAKKTLIRIAGEKKNLTLDRSIMEGPVSATFSYEDPMAGIKVLFNFSKENEKLKLLGGVVDGKVVGPEVIQEYAKLPGREELLAKLLGSMVAPISGTLGLFNNLIAGFVRVIDAYKDKKPADAAPEEVKAETEAPKAEEAPGVNEEMVSQEEAKVEGETTAENA